MKEGTTKAHPVVTKKEPSKPKFSIDTSFSKEVFKKKKKSKSKSQGVVINEVTDKEKKRNKKCRVVGLVKRFKKLRAQAVEEISTTTKIIERDKDSETDEELTKTYDLTYNVSR